MPGPILRDTGPLRSNSLRSGLYDQAYADMRKEADKVAAEEYNLALLETTRNPESEVVLPNILSKTVLPSVERKPVVGTPVFGSDEEFAKVQQEASTLADTTPLGQFTSYRPGFKADSTLKTPPSDWEKAFPGYKPAREEPPKFLARVEPTVRSNQHPDDVKKRNRDAIAAIESRGSGDYSAVGPKDPKLGHALGRYQVMASNVGPWTKEALGYEMTPEEFLADPKAQDAVFDHIFSGYVDQFGSPEAAAQAWFAGPGGVGKTERKDVLGTSVGEYGSKFLKVRNR